MRKLTVQTFVTLDGVMQAPGGPDEDRDGQFAHGGWSVNYWDDTMMQAMNEAMAEPSTINPLDHMTAAAAHRSRESMGGCDG